MSYSWRNNSLIHNTTTIINNNNPIFNDTNIIALESNELQQHLIFSVWHQRDTSHQNIHNDQLIGSVHVDLANLTCGLREINGYYHIMDYNKQKKGQLKVRNNNIFLVFF